MTRSGSPAGSAGFSAMRLLGGQAERLAGMYDHLPPFGDVAPALTALSGMGYELAVFSNGRTAMIGNCLSNTGMRTAWVNRSAEPFNTIGAQPDLTVPALDHLPTALAS